MKTNHCTHHFFAVLDLAAFFSLGLITPDALAGPVVPPSNAVVTISVSDAELGPSTVLAATARPASASAQWTDIKDQSYALRTRFIAGLRRLETKVDDQINELTVRRDAQKGTADAQNGDFAIKQMGYARSYLKYMGDELTKATPGTWDEAKGKVGLAWARTQKFYWMGKSSTTS